MKTKFILALILTATLAFAASRSAVCETVPGADANASEPKTEAIAAEEKAKLEKAEAEKKVGVAADEIARKLFEEYGVTTL